MSDSRIQIEVIEGDVLTFEADVLALKYAQHYYGSDAAVCERLTAKKAAAEDDLKPEPWKWVWVEPGKALPSKRVLFVGVPQLIKFGYTEIADWAKQAITICGRDYPEAEHIAVTLHGPGFGLDEIEALHAELRGVVNAVEAGDAPAALRRVSIVERKPARVERLQAALSQIIAGSSGRGIQSPEPLAPASKAPHEFDVSLQAPITVGRPLRLKLRRPGKTSGSTEVANESANLQSAEQVESKPRVFVAMPFSDKMEDVFYYGIQNPVRQLGYICERVDQEAFTGDILEQVKTRIENAEIVIADLTDANPNVYLEVGYAWGKGRPTVLVADKKDELKFDVRGQKCLRYLNIKDLDKLLTSELKGLGNRKG